MNRYVILDCLKCSSSKNCLGSTFFTRITAMIGVGPKLLILFKWTSYWCLKDVFKVITKWLLSSVTKENKTEIESTEQQKQ